MCTDGGVQAAAGLYVKNNNSSHHIHGARGGWRGGVEMWYQVPLCACPMVELISPEIGT